MYSKTHDNEEGESREKKVKRISEKCDNWYGREVEGEMTNTNEEGEQETEGGEAKRAAAKTDEGED